MNVQIDGARELSERFAKLAENTRDLTPGFQKFADWCVDETHACIRSGVDFSGASFVPLKPKTILARLERRNALGTNATTGDFSKTALRRQDKFFSAARALAGSGAGGTAPLDDTGKTYASISAKAAKHNMVFKMRGTLTIHMVGSKDGTVPMRNPTPFIRVARGWALHPRAKDKLRECVEEALYR